MEAELELEKQRSMSDEAQKTRQIEAEAIRLEVEAEVLENEAGDPDSLQQRLKEFEGEEIVPVSPKEEIAKEVKPVHVVKAHLNRRRKWVKLSDDRLHEVRRFSDVISTAVKTFKRLGYTNDLLAANNLNMVVDKLPYSLRVKWK